MILFEKIKFNLHIKTIFIKILFSLKYISFHSNKTFKHSIYIYPYYFNIILNEIHHNDHTIQYNEIRIRD